MAASAASGSRSPASAYRIAEYRPPAFLVEMATTRRPRAPGDTLGVHVCGALSVWRCHGGGGVSWSLTAASASASELAIPGTDGWLLGDSDDGWQRRPAYTRHRDSSRSGHDSLNARRPARHARAGARRWTPAARCALTLAANVSDVNRQLVGGTCHPRWCIRPRSISPRSREGEEWFWRSNAPRTVRVLAVRPDGERVTGVRVDGVLVRREWHRVQRVRGGGRGAAPARGSTGSDSGARDCADRAVVWTNQGSS